MTKREIDVKDFASRVERMCDFILSQIEEKNDSADQIFIHNLKKDAADIQFNSELSGDIFLRGLDKYIRGTIHTSKE